MENNRINRKDQKAAGGNWGHPRKFIKRHTNIPDRPEVSRVVGGRKYKPKKIRKPCSFDCCPFCKNELRIVCKNPVPLMYPTELRAKKCPCGARVRRNSCPACKRDSFFKDGFFRHNGVLNCGFVGQKKS